MLAKLKAFYEAHKKVILVVAAVIAVLAVASVVL